MVTPESEMSSTKCLPVGNAGALASNAKVWLDAKHPFQVSKQKKPMVDIYW